MLQNKKSNIAMILKSLRTWLLRWKPALLATVWVIVSISFCQANKADEDSLDTRTKTTFISSAEPLSLNDLDPELLFLIFQYVATKENFTSIESLSLVNRKFYRIIDDAEEFYKIRLPALEQKITALETIRIALEEKEKLQTFFGPSPTEYLSRFSNAGEEIDDYDEFSQYKPVILEPQTEKEKFKRLLNVIKKDEITINQLHFNTYKYYGKIAAFLTFSTLLAIGRICPLLYVELYRYFSS